MNFLKMEGKSFLITGVANKKSVACHVAKTLIENGAEVFFSVQNEPNYEKVKKLFPNNKIFI
ncbi:MAG: enoyl-ACP reductase, partial [Bdellovibrionota bacterium]|nr:enoyl-ACP reductase [Bdellovibrionota bacterium]